MTPARIALATFRFVADCSDLLSYGAVETRAARLALAFSGWEPERLLLTYVRRCTQMESHHRGSLEQRVYSAPSPSTSLCVLFADARSRTGASTLAKSRAALTLHPHR